MLEAAGNDKPDDKNGLKSPRPVGQKPPEQQVQLGTGRYVIDELHNVTGGELTPGFKFILPSMWTIWPFFTICNAEKWQQLARESVRGALLVFFGGNEEKVAKYQRQNGSCYASNCWPGIEGNFRLTSALHKWLLIWYLDDDYFTRPALDNNPAYAEACFRNLIRSIREGGVQSLDPASADYDYIRLHSHFLEEYLEAGYRAIPHQEQRYRDLYCQWMETTYAEHKSGQNHHERGQESVVSGNGSKWLDLEAYLRWRFIGISGAVYCLTCECTSGTDMSAVLPGSPSLRELNYLTMAHCALVNDSVSFEKELYQIERQNAVYAVIVTQKVKVQEALDTVGRAMHSTEKRFLQLAAEMFESENYKVNFPESGHLEGPDLSDRQDVRRYVSELAYSYTGNLLSSLQMPRYHRDGYQFDRKVCNSVGVRTRTIRSDQSWRKVMVTGTDW